MNRDTIIQWIYDFTPIELDFKNYYEHHKAPMSDKRFFEIINDHHGISGASDPVFSNIEASNTNTQGDDAFIDSNTDFSENIWLAKSDDVSIRKHPRFFPKLIHKHEFIEIAYVYDGTCTQTFYYENGNTEDIHLTSGALCIIPPKLSHNIAVYDDSIVINILIRTSTMRQTLTNLVAGNQELFLFFIHTLYENSHQNYICFDTNDDDRLQNLIIDMMLEACENKAFSQKAMYLQLGLFFTYLQRDYTNSIRFSESASVGIQLIPRILEYMQRNFATTSVADIAEHFFLSKSYVSRIFKANTNMTIINALQQIRITNAKELLKTSRLSVQQIAEYVGYSDVTFFIRVFHKACGTTPLQYRNSNQV